MFKRQFMLFAGLWLCFTVDINIYNWIFCVLGSWYQLCRSYNFGNWIDGCRVPFPVGNLHFSVWIRVTSAAGASEKFYLNSFFWQVARVCEWVKRAWMLYLKPELCWKCSCSCSLGNICAAGRGNLCISIHPAQSSSSGETEGWIIGE